MHLNTFWYMGEQRYPEVVERNRDNWMQLGPQLADSLSAKQKEEFLKFLNKLINSLEKISSDTPKVNLDSAFSVPTNCQANALNT